MSWLLSPGLVPSLVLGHVSCVGSRVVRARRAWNVLVGLATIVGSVGRSIYCLTEMDTIVESTFGNAADSAHNSYVEIIATLLV